MAACLPPKRRSNVGLETSVVYRFDTGPTFIDTDGLTYHPPEYHHNQGVNLSSVIFAIFRRADLWLLGHGERPHVYHSTLTAPTSSFKNQNVR